jgi:hypothetical protein
MTMRSFLCRLVFALIHGCLVGLNNFFVAKYLVLYHGLSWSLCGSVAALHSALVCARAGHRLLVKSASKEGHGSAL